MGTNTTAYRKNHSLNIGIDVGKATLDIAVLERQEHWQISNSPAAITNVVTLFKRLRAKRIVVEATGGYERGIVDACAAAALPLILVQPIKVRQFARAEGVLAKTDKIDAYLIARFAKALDLAPRPLPDKKVQRVRDLLARKRQLVENRTQELNRKQKGSHASAGLTS